VNYVLTADLHLRADVPLCRKETSVEWLETQRSILSFIVKIANENKADIIDAGDNFNTPRVPDEIKSLYLQLSSGCKQEVHTIPANHTLPWHQKKNINESSIGVMRAIDQLHTNLHVYDCDEFSEEGRFEHSYQLTKDILICHTLTYPSADDIPIFTRGISAYKLLSKYKPTKWIITGDNHHNFHVEDDGRHVINPGTPIIQVADMIDYEPGIYLLNTDTEELQWIPVPNDRNMLTDNHLSDKIERNGRIDAFIEVLKNSKGKDGKAGLSFEDNLRRAIESTDVDDEVRFLIEELLNGRPD
jgi:hypothetical protein